MHTRQQAHPHTPPHRLRHPSLIHIPQPRLPPPLDPPTGPTELTHHRHILPLLQRVYPQHVEHIPRRPRSARGLAFCVFRGGQVVRGVDFPLGPAPGGLPLQLGTVRGFGEVPQDSVAVGRGGAGEAGG